MTNREKTKKNKADVIDYLVETKLKSALLNARGLLSEAVEDVGSVPISSPTLGCVAILHRYINNTKDLMNSFKPLLEAEICGWGFCPDIQAEFEEKFSGDDGVVIAFVDCQTEKRYEIEDYLSETIFELKGNRIMVTYPSILDGIVTGHIYECKEDK